MAEENKKEKQKEMSPREMRIAFAEANKKEVIADPVDVKEAFRVFFAKKKASMNLDKDLEKIIYMHIRSSGHLSPELFEQGFSHFFGNK